MFKKWGQNNNEDVDINDVTERNAEDSAVETGGTEKSGTTNTILKGSKLSGDINVTCDLELSGEIEGNITSEQNSNIVIKGRCKGNIETRDGNVDIEGELHNGNITAGKDVKISGKVIGGEVKAKGRIHLNGEFDGKLEGNEIEIGPRAQGRGEIIYREYISISKGANIEGHICKVLAELKLVKNSLGTEEADMETPAREVSEA
ncbi:MAG TPA: polymer-forming cytoskeletal protein [Nitrospirae bacterium]|nr:polymer-forming cytoskeletal protein [Nitrospirota bacterium]